MAVIARGLAADPHDAARRPPSRSTCGTPAGPSRFGCWASPRRARRHGPRTELTHQVPGRRPRPAPVIVATTGDGGPWRALRRIRRTTTGVGVRRRAGAAALVLAVGCGAVWLTAPWEAPGPTPGSAADETAESGVPAAEVRAADVSVAAGAAPTGTSTGPPVTPRSTAEWQQLLDDLYALRAEAFATGRTEPLAAVYAAGSPLARSDEQQVAALDTAGERLRGFRPRVVTVEDVAGTGDRRELRLVDRWAGLRGRPGHGRRRAGAAGGCGPRRRPPSAWCWSGPTAGWRIEERAAAGVSRQRRSSATRSASARSVSANR